MDNSLLRILHLADPFHTLDDNELDLLIHDGEVVEFNNHDAILTQGRPGPGLYLLLHGKVNITVNALGKGTIHLATLKPGQFFGEVNLIEHTLCTATVKAKGKVLCFFLSKLIYDMFYLGFPLLHYKISQSLLVDVLKRQRAMCTLIQSNSKKAFREKINLTKHSRKPAKHYLKWSNDEKIATLGFLTNLPIFSSFSKHEILKLITYGKVVEACSHYALVTADSSQAVCYFILTGSGMIQIPSSTGDITISTLGPNKWLCATSLIDKTINLYHARVGEIGRLLEFNKKTINMMIKQEPELWSKMHDLLCQACVAMQKNVNTQIIRMSCEKNKYLDFARPGEK